jgi:hypothetical protein
MPDFFQVIVFFFMLFIFAFPTLKKVLEAFLEASKKNKQDPRELKKEHQNKVEVFEKFLDTLDEEVEDLPPTPPPYILKNRRDTFSGLEQIKKKKKIDLKNLVLMHEILEKPLALRKKK